MSAGNEEPGNEYILSGEVDFTKPVMLFLHVLQVIYHVKSRHGFSTPMIFMNTLLKEMIPGKSCGPEMLLSEHLLILNWIYTALIMLDIYMILSRQTDSFFR